MFDMFKMLGKMNEIKAEASKIKEELKFIEITASDAEGIVTVTATGDKNIKEVKIDNTILFPENHEKIQAAVLEATSKALKEAGAKSKDMIQKTINEKYPEVAGMGLDKWLS